MLALLQLSLVWLALGCSTPSGHDATQFGEGQLGDRCQQTEDCASGICVRLADSGGICSSSCQSDTDCPRADNWGCLAASNIALRVCACRPLDVHELCGDGRDNDCDAKVDDCRICSGVGVVNDDPKNCGACDNACRADQQCQDQTCLCPEGTKDCADRCIDTDRSASDCGACGQACSAGEACVSGVCRCPNAEDSSCPAAGCVALDSDVNNCGSCGDGCTLGRRCTSGKCQCPSAEAADFCAATGCVDLRTDVKNCGECGTVCDAGLTCRQGECGCPDLKKLCDGACVDLALDEANCGECGQTCGAQQTCIQGSCGCNYDGYTLCGAECLNLASDTLHCGSCGEACAAGEACTGGKCGCHSRLYCDGVCMDKADVDNCGQCGHACATGQLCSAGTCICQGFGLSPCGAVCVDLDADESNCGACGIRCRSGEQCYAGVCQCPLGQSYCEAAGTCVNLNTDAQNCSACGSVCDPTEICSLGTCRCQASGALYCASQSGCVDTRSNVQNCGGCDLSCKPTETCSGGKCGCATYGATYCASTTACTDTLSNPKHCGGCDKACRTGELCSAGQCRCPGAQQYCAGAKSCVDFTSDSRNCGACDNQCAVGQHCAASKCTCDQAGVTTCGNFCYDLQTDEGHCGSCNNACGAAFNCVAGSCKCPNPTLDAEVRLMTDANDNHQVSVAWDGSNVGVAYVVAADASQGVGNNLHFARIKPDGTLVGTLQVTSFGNGVNGVYEPPHLVWTGSEYGLLWVQNTDPAGMPVVMLRRIKPNGTFAAAAVQVAASEVVPEGGSFFTYRVQNAALAWSSQYGGYAAYYTREGNLSVSVLRRLGVSGTVPEIENTFTQLSRVPPSRMAVAPDGTWGIMGQLNFQLINPDGSRTTSTSSIGVGMDHFYPPPLIHDGQTFVTVGRYRIGTTSNAGLYLNRGTTTNTPALLFTEPPITQVYTEAVLAKAGESIALAYGVANASSSNVRLGLQRYAIPATLTSAVQPLHDPIDIMSTNTLTRQAGDAAIVSTTPGHLLAIWADTRWGHKQLYARNIDLHACP